MVKVIGTLSIENFHSSLVRWYHIIVAFTGKTLTINIIIRKNIIHHYKTWEADNLPDSLDFCYYFAQVSNQLCTVAGRSSLCRCSFISIFHYFQHILFIFCIKQTLQSILPCRGTMSLANQRSQLEKLLKGIIPWSIIRAWLLPSDSVFFSSPCRTK